MWDNGISEEWIPQQRISKALCLLRHREIFFTHIWMDKQSFVVLGKLTAHCVNMGGASIHLQKYFIDKLRLHSVTAQIRLPLCTIVRQTKV
mgnify:CR=1 FL=1